MFSHQTKLKGILVSFSLLPLLMVQQAHATAKYNATLIGQVQAWSLNDKGQVVGAISQRSGQIYLGQHAFIWDSQAGLTDLYPWVSSSDSIAKSINNKGQIAGDYASGNTRQAFVWDSVNGKQNLGTLGGDSSYAEDINDKGNVVGWSKIYATVGSAYIWNATEGMKNIGSLGGTSVAYAVNNHNQVTGKSSTAYNSPARGRMRAFLWDNDNGMKDLGTLGTESRGWHINDLGQVIGTSNTATQDSVNFFWDPINGMKEFITLNGTEVSASLFNDLGDIIGVANSQTVIYRNGKLSNLTDLLPDVGVSLSPIELNDKGQILATGYKDNIQYSYLFSPAPEPASMLLLASGLIGMLGIKSRKK